MGVGPERSVRVVLWSAASDGAAAAAAEVLLSEGREPLLLRNGIDIGADDERDEIEERDPEVVGQELLGEGKADGRGNPADLHDLPEAYADGSLDLMDSLGTSDEGHGNKVHAVLDWRDLGPKLARI